MDEKAQASVRMLQECYKRLGRLPVKSDFTAAEVCLIKQKLGPWHRALEAAGLKTPPAVSAKEKNRLKRQRSQQRRKINHRAERKAALSDKEENNNEHEN